jgi:predicted DsbA family dithiol-disulfide isomerase
MMVQRLEATATHLGLPFGRRTKTYNSRLAQELGLWATDQGRGEQFHMAAFHAYFASGLNISKLSILLNIAEEAGLSKAAAEQVIMKRSYRERVDEDWHAARSAGITAVPTLIMGDHRIVGNQNYEILQQLVILNGIERK